MKNPIFPIIARSKKNPGSSFLAVILLFVFFSLNNSAPGPREPGESHITLQMIEAPLLFKGLGYGPHRDNQDPDFGIQPLRSEIKEDLLLVKQLTPKIRTYGIVDGLEQIPLLCDSMEIDCWPGAWISEFPCENERQIEGIIEIANMKLDHIKGLIVGNEVLLRHDVSQEELIAFIERVRMETDSLLPIATAEIWLDWQLPEHQALAEAVDVIFLHVYPYWDGIAIEDAMDYILQKWTELKERFPNKEIVIGETGWPSTGSVRGEAVPSPENQKFYISEFVKMAEENEIDYFYFEIFDEKWKTGEGDIGTHWGMYNSQGVLKPSLESCVPESARIDTVWRARGLVDTVDKKLPTYIYKDGCDTLNCFFASGWMGELADIFNDTITDPIQIINEIHTDQPYSGTSCIRISYAPSFDRWGGIYWQFRVNNWGEYPGYDLTEGLNPRDNVKLSFWARGELGGERGEFLSGGIYNLPHDTIRPYSDSYSTNNISVTLSKKWEKFEIDLTGKDLSNVMGGFAWVTNYTQNPNGATIYLDEIVIETGSLMVSTAEEPSAPEWKLFPNPVRNDIYLSCTEAFRGTVRFFNTSGKLLREQPVDLLSGETAIDLNHLPKGVILIQVSDWEERVDKTWKVLKLE